MSEQNGVTGTMSAVERLEQRRLAKAAEERAVANAKDEEAALLELENLDAIDALKAKYPGVELTRVDTVKGMAVIRTPDKAQFSQYQRAQIAADQAPPDAQLEAKKLAAKVLAEAGTVHPSYEVLERWVAEGAHSLYGVLGNRIIELCGSDTTVKKL